MKIIICSTFRDFKGTDNDKIQYMFLENLKKQTYQDFVLVTTTFGEKNVKKVVDDYLGEKSVVRDVEISKDYRFSLTEVVLSGIIEAEKCKEDCIFVWSTCDIQIEETFFQTLVDNYSPNFSGIVHPNIIYSSLDDLNQRNGVVGPLDKGIDILFFDAKILIKAKQDVIDYRFNDWGVFEYFMVAIGMKYSKNRINLFCKTKVKKVVNNRTLTNESINYFLRCIEMNKPVLDSFVKDNKIAHNVDDVYLYNAHKLFEVVDKDKFYKYIKIKFDLLLGDKSYNIQKTLHMRTIVNWIFGETKSISYKK